MPACAQVLHCRLCAGLCLRHRRAHFRNVPRSIRRPPSSLYTFRGAHRWRRTPGLARRCLGRLTSITSRCHAPGGSPNLKGSAPTVSSRALNCFKSAMFTNFITRAGWTRFYHRRSPTHASAHSV